MLFSPEIVHTPMKRMMLLTRCLLLFYGLFWSLASPAQAPSHPRGLITQAEVAPLRARMQQEPWRHFLQQLETRVNREMQRPPDELDAYDNAYLCSQLSGLYLLTNEGHWAGKAWTYMQRILADPIFTEPTSRGLTRAMLLQQAAISYDLCYTGWTEAQRTQASEAIFSTLLSVSSNMGTEANYNLASNWMGVRYGAVVLAASVWDDPLPASGKRSRALPFLWDATKRLQDHVEANLYENGWNGESMGYHAYNWSFIAPAIIALQNGTRSDVFDLLRFIPKAQNSLWAISTSQIDIPTQDGRGMKADLSDDNLGACPPGLLATGMRLFPPAQLPYLQWMFDYRFPPDQIDDARNGLLFSLLYYPQSSQPRNPAEAGWLNYHDPEQGVAVFRNRFQDSTDVVFTLSATARRVRGHQGPDTHAWRLLGLGVPWVIGGGRTGATHLQTNLYPDSAATPRKSTQETGTLIDYGFRPAGGYAISAGSCLGVIDHLRKTQVDYSPETGCAAAFLLQESSQNGRRWRIQTPEFNAFEALKDGYLLTAPNGATLRVKVLAPDGKPEIRSGLHRYGGETVNLNPGIRYAGKAYPNSRWIDVACEGGLTVLITLQEAGKEHPAVRAVSTGGWQLGNRLLY